MNKALAVGADLYHLAHIKSNLHRFRRLPKTSKPLILKCSSIGKRILCWNVLLVEEPSSKPPFWISLRLDLVLMRL